MTITLLQGTQYVAPTPDVIANAPTGVAAIDGPMLAAAVAATPVGGILRLHGNSNSDYVIAGSLNLKNITLQGVGVRPVISDISAGGNGETPTSAPWLSGTVIRQTLAGAHGITFPQGCHIRGVGVVFDPAIRFVNTGHGFYSYPATTYLSKPGDGWFYGTMDNVACFGHDGNHYAFDITNPLLSRIDDYYSCGGGVMRIFGQSAAFNYGNMKIGHGYGRLCVGGSAHGFHLAGDTGRLNILTFIRPQCNIGRGSGIAAKFPEIAAAPAIGQHYWISNNPSIGNLVVIAPNFETANYAADVRWGTAKPAIIGGVFLGADNEPANAEHVVLADPLGGARLHSDMSIRGARARTVTVVPEAAAGTGATAVFSGGSTDDEGVITLTVGTTPGTGLLATLTWPLDDVTASGTIARVVRSFMIGAGSQQALDLKLWTVTAPAPGIGQIQLGTAGVIAAGQILKIPYIARRG